MRYRHFSRVFLASSLALAGCAAGGGGESGRADLAPRDFVNPARPAGEGVGQTGGTEPALQRMDAAMEAASQGEIGVDVPAANPAAPEPPREQTQPPARSREDAAPAAEPRSDAAPTAAPTDRPIPLDGMVGQVNGRAIYTSTVFDAIGEQLAALGRQLPPSEFRQRARELIRTTLDQIVADALILGEANRNLTEREQMGLDMLVRSHREELLRKHGQGSLAVADAKLREETGYGVDETLRNYRQQKMVENHIRTRVIPRINVNRRDVERYYNDHPEEFNPSPKRTLRLIRVADDAAASEVRARLDGGEAFAELAANAELNRYNPDTGGVMEAGGGEQVFDNPELNSAMLRLEQGEWAGPVTVGSSRMFVFLERYVKGEKKALRDVQLQIERTLREDQYRMLSGQERQRLLKEGNYNPLPEMVDALLEIAVARYSMPVS